MKGRQCPHLLRILLVLVMALTMMGGTVVNATERLKTKHLIVIVDANKSTPIDLLEVCYNLSGNPLTYTIDKHPSNGRISLAGNVATYTPKRGFTGGDGFTYFVSNGATQTEGAVAILVLGQSSPQPSTGRLTIQKRIEGGGNLNDKFEVAIIPQNPGLTQPKGPIYISVNKSWQGELEPGTYKVVEVDMPPGYYFEEMSYDGEITIPAGSQYVITIVNRYEALEPPGPEEPTEPEEPEVPEGPEEPEVPVDPEIPEEEVPEEPVDPGEPTDPGEPVDPEEPSEPTEPSEPGTPEEPSESEPEGPGISALPKTTATDVVLALGIILTLGGLWLSRKRK